MWDGANDCSALISADVGISLKSRENIIMTSHLMAKTKSIAIINDILNIGKTCYENSTIILKVLLIYSEIKTASRCLMMKNDNMTKNQYFFLDCIIVLFGCCLMSTSDPNYKMKKQNNPNISEFKINYYLISIIGHTIFQIGLLMIYYFYIIYKYDEKDLNDNNNNDDYLYSHDISSINSYIFFFNSVQSLSLIFVSNFFSIYKENIFKNRLFNLYLIINILILSELMSVDNYKLGIIDYDLVQFIDINKGGHNSQTSRLYLLLFCGLSFLATFFWELLLGSFKSNNCCNCIQNGENEKKNEIKKEIRIKKLI